MASLITENDVRVLTISGDAFNGILRERPSVALAVLQSLSGRLREVST
jgi:CRP-like cAMP-binding protein